MESKAIEQLGYLAREYKDGTNIVQVVISINEFSVDKQTDIIILRHLPN
jgi:hypothetical protein